MYDADGWIDSAEQADDVLNAIRCALIAIAKSQERIAHYLESTNKHVPEVKEEGE